MIIDIDMVPNLKLRDNFLNFASSLQLNSKKIVYVVPVFEVQTDAPIPENKNELIALVKEKKARPFYFVPCRSCQKYTGYNKWLMSQNVSGEKLSVTLLLKIK